MSPERGNESSGLGEEVLRKLEAGGARANPYRAGRSVTMSHCGLVASSHYLASQAGVDMLRNGGNAMDAAVATAATLAVVEPMMTGLGGDAFFLYYDASERRVWGLNGSGRSPHQLTRQHFSREQARIDQNGWEAVTVPGAVDAWIEGLERFGSKPLQDVLAPAIHYAEAGFPVTEVVHSVWCAYAPLLRQDACCRESYLVEGEAPALGSRFQSPDLARTLRLIATDGRDAFYRGPIAEEVVRYAHSTGGYLTLEDFGCHASEWVEPISTGYRGFEVYQIPPNGQGIGVLLMLNLLDGFELDRLELNSPEYLHLLIEAKKLAYADLGRFVADPEHASVPVSELLSRPYADEQRQRIDPHSASAVTAPGVPGGNDTVYLTAVDQAGNAVSFINSLFDAFGAKIVGGSTGLLLQSRGSGFTLEPGHPNEYAPRKRPFHTIIPGMVLRSDRLALSYGVMGGPMQPQGHVQLLLAYLERGLGLQEAVDLPRWRHTEGREVLLEHGTPETVRRELTKRGHHVVPAHGQHFGGAQAIAVNSATGTFLGASDPRKDGIALGF